MAKNAEMQKCSDTETAYSTSGTDRTERLRQRETLHDADMSHAVPANLVLDDIALTVL